MTNDSMLDLTIEKAFPAFSKTFFQFIYNCQITTKRNAPDDVHLKTLFCIWFRAVE